MTTPLISESDLAEFRELAESEMTATVRFSYKTERSVQNESTGKEEPIYATRFETLAKFQSTTLATNDLDIGGRRVVIDQVQIHYPVSQPQAVQDDIAECLTNPRDPRLEGRKFIVGGPANKTDATATRLIVKEMP